MLALPETTKYQVGVRRGLVCLMGRGDSLALVGDPPRDGVLDKHTGSSLTLNQLSSNLLQTMSYNNMSDNGVKKTGRNNTEGLSPGSCSVRTQAGFGRHTITARRRKWTKEENMVVMECYYKSKPHIIGYRKRMYRLWNEKGLFITNEQRLVD